MRIICLSLLLTASCIDPYEIDDVVDGQPRLVIDGLLTNQPQAHEVKIWYSSPSLRTFDAVPVTGADVFIEDENGTRVQLSEGGEGAYFTPSDFAGTVGLAYTLNIRTSENAIYKSLPEVMPPVAEIDSVFAAPQSRTYLSSIGTQLEEWGMEFYLSTGTGLAESNFYRWDWEETYEFMAPLVLEVQLETPICYQSGKNYRSLLLGSSQDFTQDRIERQPVTFVSKRTYKLQRRYSLLVKQYSLTERAFNFWSDIDDQRNIDGSLFDPPPSRVLGNMVREDNPDEPVLGYFQVSAVTEERVFLNRVEVPVEPGGAVGGFSSCQQGSALPGEESPDGGESPEGGDEGPPDFCYDCRLIPGVTTERPSFW